MSKQETYFAGGCFWCVEAIFQRINGVISVMPGYCNGNGEMPDYQKVCTGTTGYAEVIKIVFDEDVVSFNELLKIFFATHDATTLNKQGADVGTQYRSGIFYINNIQQQQTQDYIKSLVNHNKITTEVAKLDNFYKAESYHKNYFNNNKSQPYCEMVISPKIKKYFNE